MKKILLMVVAALMAINANAQQEIVKKVRVYERNNLVYENYYSSVDSIVFVDIIQNPEYSKAYILGVSGSVDWRNKVGNNPTLTGDLGTLVNSLVDNISDNDLRSLGMTISDRKDGIFFVSGYIVVLTPSELSDMQIIDATFGQNWMTDDNVLRYKTITRGNTSYNVWILPADDQPLTNDSNRDLVI